MEGPMEYNKEQQEVLIQDFIDMLFVLSILSQMGTHVIFMYLVQQLVKDLYI